METNPDNSDEAKNFNILKREFGKTEVITMSFHPSWYEKWPWLHYNESEDSVRCHSCAKASLQKKIQWSISADQGRRRTRFDW